MKQSKIDTVALNGAAVEHWLTLQNTGDLKVKEPTDEIIREFQSVFGVGAVPGFDFYQEAVKQNHVQPMSIESKLQLAISMVVDIQREDVLSRHDSDLIDQCEAILDMVLDNVRNGK